MSYNPVADNNAAAIKVEAAAYAALYAQQGEKHVRYSWMLWAGIACLLLTLLVVRLIQATCRGHKPLQTLVRFCSKTTIFGHNLRTSRLQIACLAVYCAYNLILSFADIPYGTTWRYTSKHSPGYVQRATPMQFIANRTGFLAFASIPLIFLSVTRYNIFTLCSGIPYNALNLVHRFAGWTVFGLTWVHTLLWTIEMGANYHSAGGYLATRWRKRYWLGGFFATFILCWMCLHALASVRRYTGYEFFRITHNLGSVLFIIGCWVHWPTAFQWVAAALAIYYADHMVRWSTMLFHLARAGGLSHLSGEVFHDEDEVDVACVRIADSGLRSWHAGQHVYLYCLSLGEWEPHPFSVANTGRGIEELRLIIRRQKGMTQELLDTLQYKSEPVRVLVDGPYNALNPDLLKDRHVLMIAGGTGISFILSVLYELCTMSIDSDIHLKLVWFVRRKCKQQDIWTSSY